VKINLSTAVDNTEELLKQASSGKSNATSEIIQTQTISYDNTYSITATLVPVKPSISATTSLNPIAAATEVKIRNKIQSIGI
jgi:hypothetical protein